MSEESRGPVLLLGPYEGVNDEGLYKFCRDVDEAIHEGTVWLDDEACATVIILRADEVPIEIAESPRHVITRKSGAAF